MRRKNGPLFLPLLFLLRALEVQLLPQSRPQEGRRKQGRKEGQKNLVTVGGRRRKRKKPFILRKLRRRWKCNLRSQSGIERSDLSIQNYFLSRSFSFSMVWEQISRVRKEQSSVSCRTTCGSFRVPKRNCIADVRVHRTYVTSVSPPLLPFRSGPPSPSLAHVRHVYGTASISTTVLLFRTLGTTGGPPPHSSCSVSSSSPASSATA